ncbi:MAG: hypothetical protein HC892_08545 [Saprospiraceae bacterium]|nr:hypothetical protein [Saprospiraceae bacterium]
MTKDHQHFTKVVQKYNKDAEKKVPKAAAFFYFDGIVLRLAAWKTKSISLGVIFLIKSQISRRHGSLNSISPHNSSKDDFLCQVQQITRPTHQQPQKNIVILALH